MKKQFSGRQKRTDVNNQEHVSIGKVLRSNMDGFMGEQVDWEMQNNEPKKTCNLQ